MRVLIADALEAVSDRIRPRDENPFAAIGRSVSRDVRAGMRDWKRYQKSLPKSQRGPLTFNGLDELMASDLDEWFAKDVPCHPDSPPVDDVAPPSEAGAASAAGLGGHPVYTTSELLEHARRVIVDVFELDKNGGIGPCFLLVRDLADRAAQLRAEGD